MKYDGNMDEECLSICDAINQVPGIFTVESCCGHGKHGFRIWFKAETLIVLPNLLYWIDICHGAPPDWRVTVSTDCGKSPATFCLEGPVGDYAGANIIAGLLMSDKDMEEWVKDRYAEET